MSNLSTDYNKQQKGLKIYKKLLNYKQINPTLKTDINKIQKTTLGLSVLYKKINTHSLQNKESAKVCNLNKTPNFINSRYDIISNLSKGTFCTILLIKDKYNDKAKSFEARKFLILKIIKKEHYRVGYEEIKKLLYIRKDINLLKNHVCFKEYFILESMVVYILFEKLDRLEFYLSKNIRSTNLIKTIQSLAYHLLNGVDKLNQKRLSHCDIKPQNIMASKDGLEVKLIDFGNVVLFDDFHIYESDYEIQSIPYRAPEVLMHLSISKKIDVWSIGCVLIEIITKKRLFDNRSNTLLLIQEIWQQLGPFPKETYAKSVYWKKIYATEANSLHMKPHLKIRKIYNMIKINHYSLLKFIKALLEYDPNKRLCAKLALQHEFITNV